MARNADLPEENFEALVAQCLARIQASGHPLPDPTALARRLARIISRNRQRGRVPQHAASHPRTGIPDSYVDEVLAFYHKEEHTLRALREGDRDAWARVLDLLGARAYGYLLRRGVEAGQARQLAQDFAQACAVTLWEQALERFPYDTHFDAWVSRIAAYEVSQCARSTKEQRQQRALSLDAVSDPQLEGTLYELCLT